MKVADYILDFLVKQNTKHVFLITGGAIMFTIDAFKNRKDIGYVCVQNEQAAAMAADAYSRMGKGLGVTMATSGPGATNLLTGICCSWFDSIPVLHLTGQVNTTESALGKTVRQVGFQETDIVSIVKPITKYAVYIDDPQKIRYHLEKAVYLARSGRPGPVLLDIPMNIQRAKIDEKKLAGFAKRSNTNFLKNSLSLAMGDSKDISIASNMKFSKNTLSLTAGGSSPSTSLRVNESGRLARRSLSEGRDPQIIITAGKILSASQKIIRLIRQSQRPVIISGGGVRNAQATRKLETFARRTGIPVALTFMGIDTLTFQNPLHAGLFGTYGLRGANFTVANSDLLLCLGTRLDVRQTGTSPQSFGRAARKIVVDIDPNELLHLRLGADMKICADVKELLTALNQEAAKTTFPDFSPWQKRVRQWKKKYPACLPEYYEKGLNPYVFMKALTDAADENDVIIPDAGANLMWAMQSWELKKGQRLFSAGGMSPMGYSLPAAIGATFALDKKPVIATIGDGGLQINPQELETLAYYRLPVKLFIINNRCYGIIKQFQRLYLSSNFQATDEKSGYGTPDFVKLARAYNLKAVSLRCSQKNLKNKIRKILKTPGPVVCDVLIDKDSVLVPKLEVFHPIEDAIPYLPRKEFLENMIIPPYVHK